MDSPEKTILPESWMWTKLMESCQYLSTGVEKFEGKIEYYSTGSIQDGYYKPEGLFSFSERPSRANRMVQQGDILQARMASTNKALLVNEELDGKLISTGFIQLRPFNCCKSMSSYIYYYIQSPDFFKQRDAFATGSTQVALTDNGARNLSFPLAPFPEQHRIVARIEQLFTNLDAGVEALKAAHAQLKRYRQSVLKSACEGRLAPNEAELAQVKGWDYEPAEVLLEQIQEERRRKWEEENKVKKYKEPVEPDTRGLPELPEGWLWVTVEQVGDINEQAVLTGPFGSNLGREDFMNSGVPVLTIGCLTEQGLSLEKAVYISKSKASELGRYKVKAGDVLFSRMATVGRADLVLTKFEGSMINYHLMRLRLAVTIIDPMYFISYVRGSQAVVDYIKKVKHGATRDGINTNQLLNLPIALPPFTEQHRIVAEVERRLSVADEMEKTIDQSLKQADHLCQSILKRAFLGKLVPQNPDDEPASVLLERVKAEKAKRDAEKKAKKRRITRNIKMMEVMKETKKVIKVEGLYDILLSSKKTMTPKELWQLSKLDIEEFYAQLKVEVEKGRVIESRPNDSDVYLEIGK